MGLQTLKRQWLKSPEKVQERLDASIQLLDEACDEVRSISKNLKASNVARYGLNLAIERICNDAKEYGKLELDFKAEAPQERLPQKVEMEVYAIVSTLVENILRHSESSKFWVRLEEKGGSLQICIADNGIGMGIVTRQKLPGSGNGLRNVLERVQGLGGEMKSDFPDWKGHKVEIMIPLEIHKER
jgi:signal transduction histidine kinase